MAFQEFNQYSERRKAERAQKLRKRIAIGVGVVIVLLILVASVVAVAYKSKDGGGGNEKPQKIKQTQEVSRVEKNIKIACGPTEYRQRCESTLKKMMKSNTSAQNKDFLKAAIAAIEPEIVEALGNFTKINVDDPRIKKSVEVCNAVFHDAKEELLLSGNHVADHDMKKLPARTHELNNWLSAVMSYQQTCIDNFPDGELKETMEQNLETIKEMTSNALAIVSEAFHILLGFNASGTTHHRRLLSKNSSRHSLDKDDFPSWMSHEDRRMLKGDAPKETPNVIVAKDESGAFKTISEALTAMPKKHEGRYVIYVKEGVYDETVTIEKDMQNVTMYGDGSQKTIVTGSKNAVDGVPTFQTATFAALGNGFIAKAMGFRNTAGPEKHQAVALRVQSDRSIFLNCRMEGYQDTLYVQTHRQFFRSCVVTGTVDFIFGDAAVILQNCVLTVRKPLDGQQNILTAQGRVDKYETTGIVLHSCKIQPDEALVPVKATTKSYLGRPWKEYSRTIVMESTIEDFIHPEGWFPWKDDFALKTLYYAEFNNKGPGAKTTDRVKWPGRKDINKTEAMQYTVEPFLQVDWVKAAGAPVKDGMFE